MKQYKVYLCNFDWEKIKDSEKGGTRCNVVFDKTMKYKDYEILCKNTYLYLVDKDVLKQLEDIRNYIKQSDLDKMLWGKELMKILDRDG